MHWLWANKEWLFSGVGIVILGLLYRLVVRQPPPLATTSPGTQSSSHLQPAGPHADSPTPDDIQQQLASLPLFQRKAATNSYTGLRVRWKVKLAELVEESEAYRVLFRSDATHTLRATYGAQARVIVAAVNIERFPLLKISHYGTPMELFGTITHVSEDGGSVRLADVRIDFEADAEVRPNLPAGNSAPLADYRIERDGTLITILSDRATRRGKGPRPKRGWRVAFKSRYEAAEFVEAGEADGFTFEGKEFL